MRALQLQHVAVLPLTFALTLGCPAPEPPDEEPRRAEVVHHFGDIHLEPFEESFPCVQWTLNNEQALYVEATTIANRGGFHHSNWLVVPETAFPGEDGFFECQSRHYDEVTAALSGTFLVAQSTQSQVERQFMAPGKVIKVPPRHKVIAGVHLLNSGPRPMTTEARMTLEIIHPADVDVVLTPMRISYYDLDIPPNEERRFTAECDLASEYVDYAGGEFDLKLHWVLPHYHEWGNYFRVDVLGGPEDGRTLHTVDGFGGEPMGRAFTPPVDLSEADGFRVTCGYLNDLDRPLAWGDGEGEMCVMLGLLESRRLMDAAVNHGTSTPTDAEDGVARMTGPCEVLVLEKSEQQLPPTETEKAAPLYVPESQEGDVTPVPECEDVPADAVADMPATLAALHEQLFAPSCTYSACHAGTAPAAGLDLASADLHDTLMNHTTAPATGLPLVAPGDPDGSWLYRLLSQCEPTDASGHTARRMPLNASTLLDPGAVAAVRDWIAAGAPAE